MAGCAHPPEPTEQLDFVWHNTPGNHGEYPGRIIAGYCLGEILFQRRLLAA